MSIDAGYIPDNGNPVEVSIADIEQLEGDSGTTDFVFTVTRSGDDSNAVTVDWDIELTTGQADANDFVFDQPSNGDVTIAPGETTANVVIEVQGDTDFEPDEDFTVTLSNPSRGATISQGTATGRILNDDEQDVDIEVSISDVTQDEGNIGITEFAFVVSRSPGSDPRVPVTVDWELELIDDQADANDFISSQQTTGQVTLREFQDANLSINVQGDTDFEGNETFRVKLSNPSVGIIVQDTATGTILNDDDEPTSPDQGEVISQRQISGQTVEGTDFSDSYEATQGGIRQSTFETLGGNDSIISFSENGSAIVFTQISTSDGDDTVRAETTVGNSSAINFSEINTGANADTVIAKNTADSGGATAIDDQVFINTGDGNDTVIAEAEGFPLRNATINTGSGNDTIGLRGGGENDLNNGTGDINGGSGDQDLLILGANSSFYSYELEDSTTLRGNISSVRGNTGLSLTGVELFQFAEEPGRTYAFDELFTGEVVGVGGFVWDDLNGNGLQDSGEPGISGVQVALQDIDGRTDETTTDVDGLYFFEDTVVNRQYQVFFSGPEGFEPTEFRVNGGANPDIDSDVRSQPFNPGVQASPQFVFPGGVFDVDAGYVALA